MRSLATRDAGSEISKALPDVIAACKVGGLRPRHRRDLGHRPGRRGDRAARRRLALRDDARVRRGVASSRRSTCSTSPTSSRSTSSTARARRTRCATCASSSSATASAFKHAPDEMPVFGTIAARFNDDGVTALYQALAAKLAEKGLKLGAGHAAAGRDAALDRAERRSCRRRACATSPRSPRRVRGYHAVGGGAGADRARAAAAARGEARCSRPSASKDVRRARRARRRPRREARPAREEAPRHVAEDQGRLRRRRVRREDPRQGDPHRAHDDVAVRHARSARSRCRVRGRRRDPALAAAGERARAASRSPPACSRSSARTRTRRACSPARATRSAPTGASTCSPTACRRSGCPPRSTRSRCTATTPTARPDIYGKVGNSGVSIATLDDMKVLYSGFDLCDPATSVSMTINGPAPTILAMFINTAIDQQLDKFRDGQRPRADRRRGRQDPRVDADHGARHGAGRHPEGGPGPEHLHLLDRVLAQGDGRHPGVLRPPRRAQLLLGVDLRLPHRRGRREPDLAARVHAVQRLHLRRGLPRARHAHRRLRAEPVVLLQLRHGPGVRGDRPRRAAHLGGGDEATATAPTSARRSSSSTRRPRAARCTRRRSRSTTSAPRCRR